MANEFKLNFTAEDINRRLTDIDNKQDNLTTGDLIEIKEGVIRSTLGDDTGEMIESYTEMVSWENMLWEGEGILFYPYNSEAIKSNLSDSLEEGKVYDIFFTLLGQNTSLHYQSDCVYIGGETPCLSFNIDLNHFFETEEFIKENEDLPGFLVAVFYDKDEDATYLEMMGDADYTGSSLSIGIFESRKKYISLPDNTLQSGNLIKIENGMIRSTLGEKIVSKKDVKLFTIDSIPSDCYSSENGVTGYEDYCNYIPLDRDTINLQLLLSGSENIVNFNNIEAKAFIDEDGYKTIYNFINTNQTYEDVAIKGNAPEKIDETLPWIGILWFTDEEENYCAYNLIAFEDITEASIQVDGNITIENIVKLPNKALTFDEEPVEDSKNLVTSNGIYRAINNVKSSFAYDGTPTPYSQNLMKSGDIYNAFVTSENKVPTIIANYISSKTTGTNIGKSGGVYGAEIFNSYGNNKASGQYSHAEGYGTTASGQESHAEGYSTTASGQDSHAEGTNTTASGNYSHAEGYQTKAIGLYSHAEGANTIAKGGYSHAEGSGVIAFGTGSHAEGCGSVHDISLTGEAGATTYTMVGGAYGALEVGKMLKYGDIYTIIKEYDKSNLTITTDSTLSSSEALNSATVSLYTSHAYGYYSHAEGYQTAASGNYSHAEGTNTTASGNYSHAEGQNTIASGYISHAEGYDTIASGNYSHAEGCQVKAIGPYSHAEGDHTIAIGWNSHVQGKYNVEDNSGKYAHIVGNGQNDDSRSNCHILDWDGNAWFAGTIEAEAIILKSSTEGSTKRFKITVDDNGTLSTTAI